MASLTNLNFSYLLERELISKAKTCSKYLTPPCINFVDFDDVPAAKSYLSISSVFNPLEEASKTTPAPLQPPPITTKS